MSIFSHPAPPVFPTASSQPSAVDIWQQSAEADYLLCRDFADRFDARLPRSTHSRRVGWKREGRSVYGILLPDPLPDLSDDWYIYYVWGETMFRRSLKERQTLRMLVLPDSTEDWAELLRQALRHDVFDVQWTIRPQYVNALGEIETVSSGYEFTLSACAPPTAAAPEFHFVGAGETPEIAARDACRRWLGRQI